MTATPKLNYDFSTISTATTPDNMANAPARKYQYWSIKFKPYFETQFSIQNKIYIDQLMQLDYNFDVASFKSFFWGETSIWYQYDSSTNQMVNGESTNYRNYFFCYGFGITVKPILMTITFALRLRNCYKTII